MSTTTKRKTATKTAVKKIAETKINTPTGPIDLGFTEAVSIPALDKRRTKVKIQSIHGSPFVPHAFGAKARKQIQNTHDGITPTKKKEPKDQWNEFLESGFWAYDKKGKITSLCALTRQLKACAVDAVRHVGDRKTLTMIAVRSWFNIWGPDSKNPKLIPLSAPELPEHLWEETDYRFMGMEEGQKSKWVTKERIKEMDRLHKMGISMRQDPARLSATQMDLRYRPAIFDWSAEFWVEYYPQFVTLEGVLNLINIGGTLNGIGEWRPSSPKASGDWGMFEVTKDSFPES